MDIYETIDNIMSSSELLEAAKHLSTLAEIGLHEKNRKQIADVFKRRLSDLQLVYVAHFLGSQDKKGYRFIFSNKEAVQHYLSFYIDRNLPPVKFFTSLNELSKRIQEDFTEPSGNHISAASINAILNYLDDEFDFTNRVYRKSVPIFFLVNNNHRHLNAVTALTDNSNERGRQFVFLYHLRQGTELTPEFVLLHELGHVVQNRYRSSCAPPESFHQFVRKESMECLSTYELCELFADAFAESMLLDSPFSQDDNQLDARLKQGLKEYMWDLIKRG